MTIPCVWEHNGGDSLLYAVEQIGAYARGGSRQAAMDKMPGEIAAYLRWLGQRVPDGLHVEIVQEQPSTLDVCDADSDVLFQTERGPLSRDEYEVLKALALRSAADFLALYRSVPDKTAGALPERSTFYGKVPRTADEMYLHTKNVNSYYFREIGVDADNEGDILSCRRRGFALLEGRPGFLDNAVYSGSYGEDWSLRKVCRRFVWHDRIHAKAMWRMALRTFGPGAVPDVFRFSA